MYKLTRCVKKHNMREPMNRHHAFLMRYSRCHVGVMNRTQINVTSRGHNLVYNGKYWILIRWRSFIDFICLGYPTHMKGKNREHRFDNNQTEGFVATLCDPFT